MATTLTPNLKLRLSDDLTADARANLLKIDALGSSTLVDSTGNLRVRSKEDITLQPNSADIGGLGSAGDIILGESGNSINKLDIFADTIDFNSATLEGLSIAWSDIDFTSSDANDIANINTVIEANGQVSLNTTHRGRTDNPHGTTAAQVGAYTTSQTDTLLAAKADDADLTDHIADTSAHGVSGDVVGTSDAQTLTNKSINASSNTITNLSNSSISSSAAIAYSKLALSGTLQVSDLASGFSLPWNSLSKTGSSLADLETKSHTQLTDIGSNTHAQIDTHIAASSAHGVSGDIVGTSDTQTLTNKTISASDNTISDITTSSLASGFSLDGSQVDPDFGNQIIKTTASLEFSEGGFTTTLQAAQAGQTADLTFTLPDTDGSNGQILQTNGSGTLSWTSTITASLNDNEIDVGDATNQRAAVNTGSVGDILADSVTGLTIKSGIIPQQVSETWAAADGTTKTITHSFGTRNVLVQVLDQNDDYINVEVNTIKRPNDNDVVLTASEAPATNWTVLVSEVLN